MTPGDLKQTGNWRARADFSTAANHLINNAHCLMSQGVEVGNYYEAEDCLKDIEDDVATLRAILSRASDTRNTPPNLSP